MTAVPVPTPVAPARAGGAWSALRYSLYPRLLRYQFRIRRTLGSVLGRSPAVNPGPAVPFYEKLWREAADALGADFSALAEGVWEVRCRGRATLIHNALVQLDDPVILDLAGNKPLSYRLLRDQGLPVPEHVVVRLHELQKAEEFMHRRPKGCFVVKPAEGTAAGRGITLYVQNLADCRRAAALASLYGPEVLIERFVPGESYRLLVLDGRLIHATRRRGLRVSGDGRSTVRQLLDGLDGGAAVSRQDPDCQATLGAQNLTWDSVPEAGRQRLARSSPLKPTQRTEMRTVFNENAADLLCAEIKVAAERAAAALRSRFAGVDVLTVDPTRPLDRTGGAINEVNTTPGLLHHYNLLDGRGPGPAVTVLKHLLGMADV